MSKPITLVDCGKVVVIDFDQFRDKPDKVEPEAGVKTWHRIFPDGKVHHYSAPDKAIAFDETFRRGLMQSFADSGLDVQLDFNHRSASMLEHPSVEDGAAPGWIVELDDRGSDGLWAAVEWTDRGLKAVRSREYRYLSPEFALKQFDKTTGQVVDRPRLFAVALTNRPFLENQQRLAASDTPHSVEGETMSEQVKKPADETQPETLALAEQVKSLSSELSAVKAQNEALAVAMSEIKSSQKKALIEEAQKAGRVTPAMLPSVQKFADAVDPDKLKEFLASLVVQINAALDGSAPGKDNADKDAPAQLSDADRNVMKAFGQTEAEYRAFGDWAGLTADGRMVLNDGTIKEIH